MRLGSDDRLEWEIGLCVVVGIYAMLSPLFWSISGSDGHNLEKNSYFDSSM